MPPQVSVVTPFFNTEQYLSKCIESVLTQSLADLEYILVDNCSTDRSGAIAERFASRDPRVRLIRSDEFRGQVENYNFALQHISRDSRYCKIVQADDWLFPRCLEAMVEVGERYANAGIIAAYSLRGTSLRGAGLPVQHAHAPGREAARLQLLDDRFLVGSPTTVMYRADIVRARRPFYELGRYHEDTEVAYEILSEHDLGFVHQVLTYQRVDDDSIMGRRRSYEPHLLDKLIVLHRYGARFLEPHEQATALEFAEAALIRFLGGAILDRREKAFWRYQAGGYATIGRRIPWSQVLMSLFDQVLDLLLNPKQTGGRLLRRLRRRMR